MKRSTIQQHFVYCWLVSLFSKIHDAKLIICTPWIQDNRVTDHRLKMNFELTSFLDGDIETAVQVSHLVYFLALSSSPILFVESTSLSWDNLYALMKQRFLHSYNAFYMQSCATLEQKEMLEELALSAGVMATWSSCFASNLNFHLFRLLQ